MARRERTKATGEAPATPTVEETPSEQVLLARKGQPQAVPGVGVGRIVHYVPADADGFQVGTDEHFAAIIVRVWSQGDCPCVSLRLFPDGTNHNPKGLPEYASSVLYSEDTSVQRTWHFPERED